MAIENHILAPYFSARLDKYGEKIDAIAAAMGIEHFIPIQFAMQVPVKAFRYTAPSGGVEGYLKAHATIMEFPATCFGGMIVVEKNAAFISEIDPDDCDGESGEYQPFECGPDKIPVDHAMLARCDVKILDNAMALDEDGNRVACPNIYEIGKPYKEDTLPIWIRPTPQDDAEAAQTELATDDEAADPATEGECREYTVEVFILEQADENGVKVRDLSQFVVDGKSLLKADIILNGYVLYKPECRMKLYCTEPLHPPTPPCTLISKILDDVQKQF
jgi:hypothetical protein